MLSQKKNQKKNKIILANLFIENKFKNTLLSLTLPNGNLLKRWSTKSLPKTRFKKNTPYNIIKITHTVNKYIKFKIY